MCIDTAYWPGPPAFVDASSYVTSHSSHHKIQFGTICRASVLICPHIQRQRPARQQQPMSGLLLLDVHDTAIALTSSSYCEIAPAMMHAIPDTIWVKERIGRRPQQSMHMMQKM